MWKATRRWMLLASGLIALTLAMIGLPGCSGGGSPLGNPGGLGQFANAVLMGTYAPAGNQPGGNFLIEVNGTGSAANITLFDPVLGTATGTGTLTLTGDSTARAQFALNTTSGFSLGRKSGAGSAASKSVGDKGRNPAALAALPFTLNLELIIKAIQAHRLQATVSSLSINGTTRTATITQAPATNPLAGRSFSGTFSTSVASGNYTLSVASNGVDISISGNVTSPALLVGTFAGQGTVGPPSTPGGTDYTLTATAKGTSGLLQAANATAAFQGKVTALTNSSITISGDVYFNGQKRGTFTATTNLSGGSNVICIEQGNNSLTLNLQNGQYTFCANGTSFTGTGTVTSGTSGSTFTHNTADRRVLATINTGTRQASATLQAPVGTTRANISDSSFADGACGACSGSGSQTRTLTPQSAPVTVRLNGNNSTERFPNLLEAGDHDVSGHKTVQGFVAFGLSSQGLPTDPAKIQNARLVLNENRAESVGQPFPQLGRLFVERTGLTDFEQISTQPLATSDITRTSRVIPTNTSGSYSADVTGIVRELIRANQATGRLRLRFETLENNDNENDLVDFFTTGTSQPRLEITFTP